MMTNKHNLQVMTVEFEDVTKSTALTEPSKRALTPKQDMFVREYLIDLNATQAAIRAGYSAKTAEEQGYQLLRKTSVAAAIQAGMDARAAKVGIDGEYVLNGIVKLIERCEQAVPVLDNEGKPTGEWRFEGNTAMRGYELLGKHLKMFTDKIEIDVGGALAERMKESRERTG
jgi:phage terminase small subunit